MKIRTLVFIIILSIGLIYCSQETKPYQIKGVIANPTERSLEIGGQTVLISEDGGFSFVKEIERPIFLDASYANLEWTVFLKPESSLDILISGKSLDAIEYKGDLSSSNTYLLGADVITQKVNGFFNQNWVQIHQQNQVDYISTIDSLKGLYLEHLTADSVKYRNYLAGYSRVIKLCPSKVSHNSEKTFLLCFLAVDTNPSIRA